MIEVNRTMKLAQSGVFKSMLGHTNWLFWLACACKTKPNYIKNIRVAHIRLIAILQKNHHGESTEI